MGKESIQSVAAAEHGRDASQLKAEHGKEMAGLKAEEAELLAAQKAEHSKTPGKTGLIAKLTGKEDPVKKAEKQELRAEIARAEESTKAAHDYENAQLKANKTNDMAVVNAADKLHGSHSHAPGVVPVAGGELLQGENHVLPADKTSRLYNHATGAHGQAALADNGVHHHNHHHGIAAFADNGLGDRHHHDHHDDNHNGGLNQGGMTQGQGMAMPMAGGAVPVAMMPVQGMPIVGAMPVATHGMPLTSGVPLATHGAPLSSVPLASHGAPLASSHSTTSYAAPLASSTTHVATPMSTGPVTNVSVLAPSHSHNGNRL